MRDTKTVDLDSAPVLIHVGLHKCGSTWLQKHMFDNAQIGFASPWGAMASMAVTEFVSPDPLSFDAAATRARLQEAALDSGAASMLVLSHEALSSRPHHGRYYAPYIAERLRAVFGKPRVLLIFREQESLIHSLYGQYLRNGGQITLREFIGTGSEPPGFAPVCKLSFFEFDRLYKMYCDVFGAQQVLAMPLEMLSRDPEQFVKNICSFSEVTYHPLPTEQKVNTAWSPIVYQILRRSNAIIRGDHLKPRTSFKFRARRRALDAVDMLLPKSWRDKAKTREKDFISARVGSLYQESNTRLSHMLSIDLKQYGYRTSSSVDD